MANSRFETLIAKEKQIVLDGMLNLPLGDGLRHAELKGMHQGLDKALARYRETLKTDAEDAL